MAHAMSRKVLGLLVVCFLMALVTPVSANEEPSGDAEATAKEAPSTEVETRFDLNSFPESFHGYRLFAYTSAYLDMQYQQVDYLVGISCSEGSDSNDLFSCKADRDLRHFVFLTPGGSLAITDNLSLMFDMTMAFRSSLDSKWDDEDADSYDDDLFYISSFQFGPQYTIYNTRPLLVSAGFNMSFTNYDWSEIIDADLFGLNPYISAGYAYQDRFFVGMSFSMTLGILLKDREYVSDTESYDIYMTVPVSVRLIDRLYVQAETFARFYIEPVDDSIIGLTPGLAYQTDRITARLGVPVQLKMVEGASKYMKRWSLDFHVSANF